MPAHELRGGHFYPLDVRAALDPRTQRAYVAACVRRALLEPASARNAARRRALAAAERSNLRLEVSGTSEAARRARSLVGSRARAEARPP